MRGEQKRLQKYFEVHQRRRTSYGLDYIFRFIVIPAAAVVGVIGYTIEGLVSSKYTPYAPSIQQQRIERQTTEEALRDAKSTRQATYENVLEKNLSESLRRK